MLPPFRADHVSSPLRPAEVRQAREDHQDGRITAQQLRVIEDTAIRRLVKQQEDIGLSGVTDGEIRRTSWHMDFFYQIAGVGKLPEKVRVPFHRGDGHLEFTADAVGINDKVRLTKTIFGEDFAFLKSVATETEAYNPVAQRTARHDEPRFRTCAVRKGVSAWART
jgi:5-methyltetrahydropteroyltriglutamate--homocysteine methyltransferase